MLLPIRLSVTETSCVIVVVAVVVVASFVLHLVFISSFCANFIFLCSFHLSVFISSFCAHFIFLCSFHLSVFISSFCAHFIFLCSFHLFVFISSFCASADWYGGAVGVGAYAWSARPPHAERHCERFAVIENFDRLLSLLLLLPGCCRCNCCDLCGLLCTVICFWSSLRCVSKTPRRHNSECCLRILFNI